MNFQRLKRYSPWLSQASAAVSLCIVVFLQIKFVFDSGNTAQMLLLIAMLTSLLTFFLGVVALPRWQGFVALGIFALVAYFILFEPMYAIA